MSSQVETIYLHFKFKNDFGFVVIETAMRICYPSMTKKRDFLKKTRKKQA